MDITDLVLSDGAFGSRHGEVEIGSYAGRTKDRFGVDTDDLVISALMGRVASAYWHTTAVRG